MNDNTQQPATPPLTLGQICQVLGVKTNTARMAWGRMERTNWHVHRIATEEEAAALREKYAEGPKTNTTTTSPAPKSRSTRPNPKTYPQPKNQTIPPAAPKRSLIPPSLGEGLGVGLFDAIIWTEISLGLIGLTRLFSFSGFIGSMILVLFFERSRRTMATPLRTISRADYESPDLYNEAYTATAEQNAAIRRNKNFAFACCLIITLTFCWGNGQTFYASIAQNADLATRTAFTLSGTAYTIADVAARWIALLMSGVAYLSLRGIALQKQTQL